LLFRAWNPFQETIRHDFFYSNVGASGTSNEWTEDWRAEISQLGNKRGAAS